MINTRKLKLKDKGRNIVYEPFNNCPEDKKIYGILHGWSYDFICLVTDKEDKFNFFAKDISFVKEKK